MTTRMAYYARQHEEMVAELQRKYNELIFAVGNKHPGETRHETALRYIQQAEEPSGEGQAECSQDDTQSLQDTPKTKTQ